MNIIFYHPFFNSDLWINGMKKYLPQATIRKWQPGDNQPADYALVWLPPHECLANRTAMKGIFALGAGVDAILKQEQANPGTLPAGVPVVRLEDTGMGAQMQEYAAVKALWYFRKMDIYKRQQEQRIWKAQPAFTVDEFEIGVLGTGVLGRAVAEKLIEFGFKVHGWSRTAKQIPGVTSFHGDDQLDEFLSHSRLLINLLPDTPQTRGILNQSLFSKLPQSSYLINLARGSHLVENDLLEAIDDGQIAGASLDVFATEPLPEMHPFWTHPRVDVTPHIAAFTIPAEAMKAIAANIERIERGEAPQGVVNMELGY